MMTSPSLPNQPPAARKTVLRFIGLLLALTLLSVSARANAERGAGPADNFWIKAMRRVHARFNGQKGTFAQFGDSITVTMAFWAPLPQVRKNVSPAMERAFHRVNDYMRRECWRDWKGPQFGSEGSTTIRWAQEHLDEWLRRLNPEAALIMFGSNDLHALELEEYRARNRAVIEKCLANGTVVILSTFPPRHGFVEKSRVWAEAAREIARELKVPLVDFQGEILKRRPDDWNGALEQFSQWNGYDVPTLIARDGVHPSAPKRFQNDYSEESLNNSGYALRNYLVLMKYAEVIEGVLHTNK